MEYQPPFGSAGPDAPYVNHAAAQGVDGSLVPAEAIEHPMREIVAAIEAAGLVPDALDLTQLAQAVSRQMPAGAVMPFASASPPTGWLRANGAAVARDSYAALDAAIYCGDADNAAAEWGYRCTDPLNPDGTRSVTGAHIVLPDMRGRFVRALDDGAGIDPSRTLWAYQKATLLGYDVGGPAVFALTTTPLEPPADTAAIIGGDQIDQASYAGAQFASVQPNQISPLDSIAAEAVGVRPTNTAALVCIKY